VVKPLGEARDFADVCVELAERMGFPLGFKDHEEFVRLSCEETPAVNEAGGFEYMKAQGVYHDPAAKPKFHSYAKILKADVYGKDTVVKDPSTGVYWDWKKAHLDSAEQALEKGYTHTKKSYKAYVGQEIEGVVYSGFKPDKVNKTGYMELYSEIMEDKGLSPLPIWIEAPELIEMKPEELILTTYKAATQIHSRSANCKWLTEIFHDNPAWINPATAERQGIADGDAIVIKSAFGELPSHARVTPAIVPGVVALSHHCGHWEYGRFASGNKAPMGNGSDRDLERIWWPQNGSHPNWIIGNRADPISGELRWMDSVVTVRKVAAA
jgi:anaerobic selenocysteine-containing dehydrogenase